MLVVVWEGGAGGAVDSWVWGCNVPRITCVDFCELILLSLLGHRLVRGLHGAPGLCHALLPQGLCTSYTQALTAFLPGLRVAGSILILCLSFNGIEASVLPDMGPCTWPGSRHPLYSPQGTHPACELCRGALLIRLSDCDFQELGLPHSPLRSQYSSAVWPSAGWGTGAEQATSTSVKGHMLAFAVHSFGS